MGEKVSTGVLDSIKEWFTGIGDWFSGLFNNNDKDLGILETTNDDLLGDNVVVDATDKNAIKLPTAEETQGFFERIWNWFTGLFNTNSDTTESENNENSTEQVNPTIIGGSENPDSTIPTDDNLNTEGTTDETVPNLEDTTTSTRANTDTSQDENNSTNTENTDN